MQRQKYGELVIDLTSLGALSNEDVITFQNDALMDYCKTIFGDDLEGNYNKFNISKSLSLIVQDDASQFRYKIPMNMLNDEQMLRGSINDGDRAIVEIYFEKPNLVLHYYYTAIE